MKPFSSFHLSLFGASCAGMLALVACGGISDPSKSGDGTVATVSGALKGGNVPDGARVALVWRVASTGAYAVTNDVPVSNGAFSMALTPPDASYLFDPNDESYSSSDELSNGGGAPQSGGGGGETDVPIPVATDAGAGEVQTGGGTPSESSGFAFASTLRPRDGASGTIGKPFYAGLAGFVVYLDTNGNGKLDISGQYASTTDTVIGGSTELALTYLRDGSALDYEKLRDDANNAPAAGFNLLWLGKSRWLPLTSVDLDLTSRARLPSNVCRISESGASTPNGVGAPKPIATGTDTEGGQGAGTTYPSPTDPALWCSDDGRTYTYGNCSTETTPTPQGLCATEPSTAPCARYGQSLGAGDFVPEGWPCTVPEATDAGTPVLDAGAPVLDASADP